MASQKSEKDVQAIIRDHEDQLNRYKKRLQDVVAAHKKLIAEKERLEETLAAVTSSAKQSSSNDGLENVVDSDKEINELKSKINKLAQSLSSLSDEKRQMEEQFLTERKQLIQQINHLEKKLKNLSASVGNSKKIQEVEVENVKSQLNLENHQRELEFSSTIRELQKILSDERNKREERDMYIEKLKNQLKEAQIKLNESKKIENNLLVQLDDVKRRLDNETAPHVVMEKLEREIQLMKEQHNYTIQQEQMRALKAEERTRRLAAEHENRVSKLEQRLAQLSDLASNHDKYRQDDQETISKLKNRLMQLELENTNTKCEDDRLQVTDEALFQQLRNVKQQLIMNCKTSSELGHLRNVLLEGLESIQKDEIKHYKQQNLQLKQQLEDYKQKISKHQNSEKIHNLKAKLSELESINADLQQELKVRIENENKLIEDERQVWKAKLNSVESDYRNKLIVMERELVKQRERVTAIIEEKDKQLVNLQQHYFPVYQFNDETPAEVKKPSSRAPRRQSSTLIYYMEDVARKEADINRLRKENNDLQVKMHEIEREHYQQMQLYTQLQHDIKRLEKQQDGAEELNTRYLKNVFYNYLVTPESKMRSHMLNAIFAILKFNDLEINKVSKLTTKK
ncbi:putative leucine-rich repeat-containing protein DDB_G0290503 [Planococcus citri]|uniref:putative leucine-rich repeat-containing protein DDB_G0290503 n=1 Tax=Planococcus citri TaxID=170843 RepID=UPI0031F7B99B